MSPLKGVLNGAALSHVIVANEPDTYGFLKDGEAVSNLRQKKLPSAITQLIVGKLTWGADGENDSFELCLPDNDQTFERHRRVG